MPAHKGIHLPLTPEQVSFLECHTGPFRTKQDVIRGLIDSQMSQLAGVATLESETDRASFRSPSLSSKSSLSSSKEELSLSVPSETTEQPSSAPDGARESESETPKKSKQKRPNYTDDFNEFWGIYQSAPKLAGKQAKFKAFEQWRKVVPDFEHPKNLIRAARLAVDAQVEELETSEARWCCALPDCFRWLRDDCYTALLEDHRKAQPKKAEEPRHPAHRSWDEIKAEEDARAIERIAQIRARSAAAEAF